MYKPCAPLIFASASHKHNLFKEKSHRLWTLRCFAWSSHSTGSDFSPCTRKDWRENQRWLGAAYIKSIGIYEI